MSPNSEFAKYRQNVIYHLVRRHGLDKPEALDVVNEFRTLMREMSNSGLRAYETAQRLLRAKQDKPPVAEI